MNALDNEMGQAPQMPHGPVARFAENWAPALATSIRNHDWEKAIRFFVAMGPGKDTECLASLARLSTFGAPRNVLALRVFDYYTKNHNRFLSNKHARFIDAFIRILVPMRQEEIDIIYRASWVSPELAVPMVDAGLLPSRETFEQCVKVTVNWTPVMRAPHERLAARLSVLVDARKLETSLAETRPPHARSANPTFPTAGL